jgi:serine/threonine protein kinase/Tfp pilus assembly protein PilF
MTTVTRTCAKCGAKIFAEAPQEFCSACFLRTGLNLLTGESVAGVADPGRNGGEPVPNKKKAARPGNTLGDLGDYELLQEIGRGGQGLVYRARQKSLNRTVALKVIGLGHWATEEHLKRFRLEAEAAASLEHPGIVPIHEVGERDGLCYFSMKLVEGGQLDEAARREPMPIRRAAELVAKVARTVHYAHEHGILHRDIKPGNILLDANGEPQLTDFGLARLVETESTVTRTKEVLGTPSYMAPEQAAGETTKVSSATDVYGLGAVLYQLLTSHPPFAGGTSYETIRLLLDTEPRQPRLWNRKIDRDLSTTCLKCLEKDPKRRYSSALALAEDLEHWLKHEPIRARRSGFFTHARKWVQRKPTIAALIASLVAFAATLGWIVWKSEFVPHPVTNGVAVLPFENLSGDPNNAYFANGIQEEILTRLASIADLKVISRTSTQHYQSKPRNLPEIAKQLGVANILEGSVQKVGDQVRVNVQLINAQTDSHLWADTFDRKLTDIFSVESEVARAVADQLRAKLTSREEQLIGAKPTDNIEAYDAYLRGLAYTLKATASPANSLGAQKYFREAVRLDPRFALAWAQLSYTDSFLYFDYGLQKTAALREEARQAADTALALQPHLGEALLAKGFYHFACLNDFDAAERYYEEAHPFLPNNSQFVLSRARLAWYKHQWKQAEMYFEEAERLDPHNVKLFTAHANLYQWLRRFPEALRKLDQALNIAPDDNDVLAFKASIAQLQGDLPRAATILKTVHLDRMAVREAFYQALLERQPRQIISTLKEMLAEPDPAWGFYNADLRFSLGWAYEIAGDHYAAQETWRAARQELEHFLKEQPDNVSVIGELALTNAKLGDKSAAFGLLERAMSEPRITGDILSAPQLVDWVARVTAQTEQPDRAIDALREVLSTPYVGSEYGPLTPELLRLDPMFDPLRGDPRFRKLCEEKQPVVSK